MSLFGTLDNRDIEYSRIIRKSGTPIPETTLNTEDGWLSPDGFLYPCERGGHHWLELVIHAHKGIIDFDRQNWIKLREGEFIEGLKSPTQAQINTIFEYSLHNKVKTPEILYSVY